MALGADTFTELVTSTLEKIDESELYDNVHKRRPSLDFLKAEVSSATGRALVVNLELAENTSTSWSDDSGTFSTAVSSDIMGSAKFPWSSPLVSSVRLKWKQVKMNQGAEQIVDLVKSHIRSMEKAHAKTLVQALHARADLGEIEGLVDGTPDEQDQFYSLDQLVSDKDYDADPAGDASEPEFNVGGIDATSQTLWQANRIELPRDGDYSIRKAFRHCKNQAYINTDGDNRPDKVLAGELIFEEFEDSFDDKVVYDSFEDGQTAFTQIEHGDLVIRLDPDCPPKRAYLLDKATLVHKSLAGTFMEQQETRNAPADATEQEANLDKVTPVASVLGNGVNERRANTVLLRPDTAGGDA